MTQAEVAAIETMSVDIAGSDRGVANTDKTHCNHGHELTGANLYIDPKRNARACRTCRDLASRRYRTKQAATAEHCTDALALARGETNG